LGRSHHIFTKAFLDAAQCKVTEIETQMETMIENKIYVSLFDLLGEKFYLET